MRRAGSVLFVLALVGPARAGEPAGTCGGACLVERARELLARGDATGARDVLRSAYEREPAPPLLFALGQVELQLDHPEAAIEYYERFLATNPSEDDASLAQQAIGAARLRITERGRRPAERRFEHRWRLEDTGLVALGGAAIAIGGGLMYNAHRRGNDRSGSLADYDARLDSARTQRIAGVALAGVGALAIGAALVHWRVATVEVTATPTGGGAAIGVARRW